MTSIYFDPDAFTEGIEIDPSEDTVLEEEEYNITLETDDGLLDPVYIEKFSGDSYGNHTVLHDDCKNTETRNGGATGFQITVDGIITEEQVREARSIGLADGAEVSVVLPLWVETYICDEFSFDKPSDLNKWYSPDYPDGVEAYTFHFKSRDPTTQGP